MSLVKFEELQKIRKKHKNQKIVYCSGCFDLTHAGHVLFFEDCKKHGDILVVGVGDDASLKEYKGDKRPILNENLRAKMVDSLKMVDYVLINTGYRKDDPLFNVEQDLRELKPDIYIFNDDAHNIPIREQVCKKFGIKMVILERWCPEEFENVSTTKIIDKIKNLN